MNFDIRKLRTSVDIVERRRHWHVVADFFFTFYFDCRLVPTMGFWKNIIRYSQSQKMGNQII